MALVPLHLGVEGITINEISPLAGPSGSVDDGESHFIKDIVPEFVATDHPSFVEFLAAYYEWMEIQDNPKYESLKMLDRRDIDDTVDDFVTYFMKEFLKNFPETFASTNTSKRKLIKNVKDFYKAKGTEKSYKLIFRLLFNETPEIAYPSKDILKLSSAKWKEPIVLKLTRTNTISNIFDMLSRKLEQRHAITNEVTAYGFIESILAYDIKGYEVLEVELSDIFGNFQSEQNVQCELADGTTVYEYVYPTVASIAVLDGASGSRYAVGDLITVSGSSLGVDALAQVTLVGLSGEINKVDIVNTGINYRSVESLTATIASNGGTGSGATLGVTGGGDVQKKSGYWSGKDGLLSATNKMQDNDYYQAFSYVVKSSRNIKDYADKIKRIIHPAGFKLFGHALLKEILTAGGTLSPSVKKYEIPMPGHYTPYRFTTARNLRENGTGGSGGMDLYPDGYGWSAGLTGFIVGETASTVHTVHGISGPLGGSTHIDESRGSGASHGTADSQGPGGTLNGPQGSQFNVVGGEVSATAVDAIDTTGYTTSDADASFTISIPTSAGGLGGTAVTILLDEDKDDGTQASAAANTITIGTFDASENDDMVADFIINVINGVAAGRFIYASEGNGQAGHDLGITAKQGSSGTKITLTMDLEGESGNISDALASASGVDIVDEEDFTGGVNALSGWGDAISSGETGGGYWNIYPHPNSRSISSIPFSKGFTQDRLYITDIEGVLNPPNISAGSTQIHVNEFVVQKNPLSQLAVGKITGISFLGPHEWYLTVNTISGMFLPYNQDMIGGSAGLIEGQSHGATGYINKIDYNVGTTSGDNEFNFVNIKDFLFGIER